MAPSHNHSTLNIFAEGTFNAFNPKCCLLMTSAANIQIPNRILITLYDGNQHYEPWSDCS